MDLIEIYKDRDALLEGHFLLSSGKHSNAYLQSARVLEDPVLAERLTGALAMEIEKANLHIECVCAPALGGILAGYELARALRVRFIFTERVNGVMTLRRGFKVGTNERVLICEDIITTGGSSLESAACIREAGGVVVGYSALANRGLCAISGSSNEPKPECKIKDAPIFALGNFEFETYEAEDCPMCKAGVSRAIKPGSRGN